MKTETLQTEPKSEIFRRQYLDDLHENPIVNDLPDFCQVGVDDDYQTYVERVTELQEYLPPGTYLLDPTFGSDYLQDDSIPLPFDKMVPGARIDTRGSSSADGFFAHEFSSPETDRHFSLAFRPHNPKSSDSVLEDFARNMFARHLGLDNTQTLGFYLTENGGGGTISLLDRSIRSLDKFSVEAITEGDNNSSVLGRVAKELAFLHAKGIAHGDVALRNIVLPDPQSGGGPYLIDWGRSNIADGDAKKLDINTAFHDVRSLEMDFVETTKREGYSKQELKELFDEHFYEAYLNWRSAFFGAQQKGDRTQSRKELINELRDLINK